MSDLLICRENASDYALQAPIRIMINQALTLLLRGGCGRLIAENHYLPVPYGRVFSISYFSPIFITSTLQITLLHLTNLVQLPQRTIFNALKPSEPSEPSEPWQIYISADIERVFSECSNALNRKRLIMTQETTQQLICLRLWARNDEQGSAVS